MMDTFIIKHYEKVANIFNEKVSRRYWLFHVTLHNSIFLQLMPTSMRKIKTNIHIIVKICLNFGWHIYLMLFIKKKKSLIYNSTAN